MNTLRSLSVLLITLVAALAAEPSPLESARALYDARKYPEARTAFEKITAVDANNAEAQYYLGYIALIGGDHSRAVACAERAAQLAPAVARYQKLLGDAYGSSAEKANVFSQFSLARKCKAAFDRAVELEPTNVEYHEAVFEYCRQAPSIVGGGTAKAEAATILKLHPLRGHSAYVTLYRSNKQFDRALDHLAAMKKLDAAQGRGAYVAFYTDTKEYDKALAQLDEVLAASPDDYAGLYAVGRFAATTGQFLDRGLAALRRCLELTPPPPPSTLNLDGVHWRIGNILEKKHDPAGARAAYEASLKFNPTFKPAAEALKKLN